ncbi:MAG: SMP-30/gluconolactonase/LRE family protein, partial [Chloroflexi bacterium]|nr:SMP-30/gluconolactonase/LRE family protein [Chloroflexota bacterium]
DIVFSSSNNYIYVTEQFNNRVQYFDTSGNYVGKWGDFGTDPGKFKYPQGLGVDASGNIYVADTSNQRIQKFTATGTHLATFGGPPAGSGDGQFYAPRDVAVDGSGNIFVADTGNHRIQKLNSSGVFITKWGGQGTNPGQFNSPYGVNVAASRIYVVDYNNSRLQTFDLATTTAWSYNQIGNMTARDGVAYSYGSKPHAVTAAGGSSYTYDANGNMTSRLGQTLTWDVENRLTAVTGGVSYVYDGDGFRVKKTENGVTIFYASKYYQKTSPPGSPPFTTTWAVNWWPTEKAGPSATSTRTT